VKTRNKLASVRPLAVAWLLVLATASSTSAGPDSRWYVGLASTQSHIGEAELTQQEIDAGAVAVDRIGRGVGLNVGYCFNPVFSLRLHITGTEHETSDPDVGFGLVGATFEGIYRFTPERSLNPFLIGGIGSHTMQSRKDAIEFDTTGSSIVLGAGLFYMFGEHLGLDCSFGAAFINWQEQTARITLPDQSVVEASTSVEGSGAAARFCLGLTWWF